MSKPLFGQAMLTIEAGTKSKLVDGLARQVALVQEVVATIAPQVPVHGALCFIDSDLPMLGTLTFKGLPLLHPKPLAKRINADGPVASSDIRAIATALSTRFPPAA